MAEVKLIKEGTILQHCPEAEESKCEKCGDWLTHWEKYTYRHTEQCCICGGKKAVGSGVVIVEYNKKEWIVPTCYICSEKVGISETKYEVYAVARKHLR